MNASEVLIERSIGVDTAFAPRGNGINGVFEALRKNREQLSQPSARRNDTNVRHHAAVLVLADVTVIDEIARLGEWNSHHNS